LQPDGRSGDDPAVTLIAGNPGWCNPLMEDLVAWMQGLFDDCSFRAPFGIGWDLWVDVIAV
jgi:hypothetical protein